MLYIRYCKGIVEMPSRSNVLNSAFLPIVVRSHICHRGQGVESSCIRLYVMSREQTIFFDPAPTECIDPTLP